MIRRVITFIVFSITSFIVVTFSALQLAYLLKFHDVHITFDISLLWFQGDNTYIKLVLLVQAFIIIELFLNMFLSRKSRRKWEEERRLSRDEKKSFSHISGTYETKKGLQRFQFDSTGHLREKTLLNLLDILFDPLKRVYNEIILLLKISDAHKLNTLKKWSINRRTTNRRSGLPILTYKRKVYVDASDSHTLIIGTTDSGKTFSLIHILIDLCRMAGESMVINDLKGELIKTHKAQLQEDGYDVIAINLVNPNASDSWNPLGIVISKYREAQKKCQIELLNYQDELVELDTLETALSQCKSMQRKNELQDEIDKIKYKLPEPDFSEASELLKDIALTLCYDANAKDPFWNSQAAILLEGLVHFLLEETMIDEDTGERIPLPDEYINFKSVKLLQQQGNLPINSKSPKTYLEEYLVKFRRPTDMSILKINEYIKTAQNTKGSISSVFADKIDIAIINESIMRMTSKSSFDLKDLGLKKTAIFLIVHDEKKTYYPLVTIFIKQLYEELIKVARGEDNLRLPIPVSIFYDEFGISPALKDMDSILAAARSRGVRLYMVIQDFSQLIVNYGRDVAKSIKNNVKNLVYLLGGDPDTLEEVSSRAGNRLVWNKEKNSFDSVRVMSKERLSRFSLGEALFLRQRKNPSLARLKAYNRYSFYKNKAMEYNEVNKPLEKVHYFDIQKEFHKKVTNSNFRESVASAGTQDIEQGIDRVEKARGLRIKKELKEPVSFAIPRGEIRNK